MKFQKGKQIGKRVQLSNRDQIGTTHTHLGALHFRA